MINADTITVTDAKAIGGELAAHMIWATNPYIFGPIHGNDEALLVRHLAAQWLAEDGMFSHAFGRMAIHNDELVGIEQGFDHATQKAQLEPLIVRAMGLMSESEFLHLAGFFDHGTFLIPEVPEDTYYLQFLSVAEAGRGKGIGERLLLEAFERARENGFARVHLDVYEGNPAMRLYERCGMKKIVSTRVEPMAEQGVPDHFRLEIKL